MIAERKRPGEAATPSEPDVQISSRKEISMNCQCDSTTRPVLEDFSASIRRKHLSSVRHFQRMSIAELVGAFNALTNAAEAMIGVQNAPCNRDRFEWIEAERERLSELRTILVDELRSRPATGDDWADRQRIDIVVDWDLIQCGEDVVKVATWMLTQQRDAEQCAARLRRGCAA